MSDGFDEDDEPDEGRPDYIKCVADTHADNTGKAWCGLPLDLWAFTGIDHAAMNGRAGGRLVACPECVAAITKALGNA